jgi:hypothetical protein
MFLVVPEFLSLFFNRLLQLYYNATCFQAKNQIFRISNGRFGEPNLVVVAGKSEGKNCEEWVEIRPLQLIPVTIGDTGEACLACLVGQRS